MSTKRFMICCVSVLVAIMTLAASYCLYENRKLKHEREIMKNMVMEESGYTENEKRAISVAIDHVTDAKVFESKGIDIRRLEGEVACFYDNPVEYDNTDWVVAIGDTGVHNAFISVIDSDTFEFLFIIPVA